MSSRSTEYRRKKDLLIEKRLAQVREENNLANQLAAMTLNSRSPAATTDTRRQYPPAHHYSEPASSVSAPSSSSPPPNPPPAFSEVLADLDFIREELLNRIHHYDRHRGGLVFVRDPPSHPTPAMPRPVVEVKGANTGIFQLQASSPPNIDFIRHEDYLFHVISTLQNHYHSTSPSVDKHVRGLLSIAHGQWEDLEEHRVKEWNRQRSGAMIGMMPSVGTVDTGACMFLDSTM